MTAETYDRVTRVPGSYEKCLAGIQRLHARGLPLEAQDHGPLLERPRDRGHARLRRELGPALPARLAPERPGGLRGQPQPRAAARRRARRWPSTGQTSGLRELRGPGQRRGSSRPDRGSAETPLYTCGAGLTGFTVDPTGQLQLCQLSRRHSFDLREGTFDEGWNDLLPALRARTWQTQSASAAPAISRPVRKLLRGRPSWSTAIRRPSSRPSARSPTCGPSRPSGRCTGIARDATCCLGQGSLVQDPGGGPGRGRLRRLRPPRPPDRGPDPRPAAWPRGRDRTRCLPAVVIVRLRVAGLTLAVAVARGPFRGLRRPRVSASASARSGRATSSSRRGGRRRPCPAPGSKLFESGGLWSVHRHGRDRLYLFREPLPGRAPYKAAADRRRAAAGHALPAPGAPERQDRLRPGLSPRRAALPAPPRPRGRARGPRLRGSPRGRRRASSAGSPARARPPSPGPGSAPAGDPVLSDDRVVVAAPARAAPRLRHALARLGADSPRPSVPLARGLLSCTSRRAARRFRLVEGGRRAASSRGPSRRRGMPRGVAAVLRRASAVASPGARASICASARTARPWPRSGGAAGPAERPARVPTSLTVAAGPG